MIMLWGGHQTQKHDGNNVQADLSGGPPLFVQRCLLRALSLRSKGCSVDCTNADIPCRASSGSQLQLVAFMPRRMLQNSLDLPTSLLP